MANIAIINLVAMIVGVVTLHATLKEDPRVKNIHYGVGFIFSIVNWILFLVLAPLLYFMVSNDGTIQTLPRFAARQKKSNPLPAYF
jgi:uncharacterized membrane protein